MFDQLSYIFELLIILFFGFSEVYHLMRVIAPLFAEGLLNISPRVKKHSPCQVCNTKFFFTLRKFCKS